MTEPMHYAKPTEGEPQTDSEDDQVNSVAMTHHQVLQKRRKKVKKQPWKMSAEMATLVQQEKDGDSKSGGG